MRKRCDNGACEELCEKNRNDKTDFCVVCYKFVVDL